jgi:hypothetical protein
MFLPLLAHPSPSLAPSPPPSGPSPSKSIVVENYILICLQATSVNISIATNLLTKL